MSDVPAELDASLRPGSVISGRYGVERVLGAGGMAVVLAARDQRLGRLVALKVLRKSAARNPELCQRFVREARVVAQMQSEHVARVLDVASLPDESQLMVLEYLEGDDLRRVLETSGPLPVSRAVDLMLEACEAVVEAHSLGIVHRDLKPANLFLERRKDGSEMVKVLDFGISKWLSSPDEDTGMTTNSDVFGSPRYMSPEQLRSSRYVTGRTDVWALAVILYELVSGSTPFDGESRAEVVGAVLHQAAKPLSERLTGAPLQLWGALERALLKDPANRTPSVQAFARDIASFGTERAMRSMASIERVCASRAGTETDADGAFAGPDDAGGARTSSQPERALSRAWPALLLGFALAVLVLLFYAAQQVSPVAEPGLESGSVAARAPVPTPERTSKVAEAERPATSSTSGLQLAPSALPVSSPPNARVRRVRVSRARDPVPERPAAVVPPASASLPDAPPVCPDLRCERK